MPSKKPYIALVIEPGLLDQITDYQFNNRFANRSQAVVDLIRRGLEDVEKDSPCGLEATKKPRR